MVKALGGRERRTYLGFTVLLPLLSSPLGVDGAAVFQILAIQELGLSASQVGLAVGLGAVSIPFQIMAARLPLSAAHRSLRLFVIIMVGLVLAVVWLLVGSGLSTTAVVVAVIAIAVLAELAVSVLYATSLQPLLATTVDAPSRQWLNGQGRALFGLCSIALVSLVGWLGRDGRIVVVVGLGVLGMVLLPMIGRLRTPEVEQPATQSSKDRTGTDWDRGLVLVVAAIGVSTIPAWPFMVTYAAQVYWPTANLGLVGAASMAGGLLTAGLWRPTSERLLDRANIGATAMVVCAVALVVAGRVLEGWLRGLATLGIVLVASGSIAVVRMVLLELAHTRATTSSSVSILTWFDVVASTCMQLGFLAAGYLISFSADRAARGQAEIAGLADPFQLSLIVGGVALLVLVRAIGRESV